jgi:hypothetical protein
VLPNQKTGLWFMCCKFVKWITVVVTVKIQINHDQNQNPEWITVTETLTRDNIIKQNWPDYDTWYNDIMEEWKYSVTILDLSTRWRWVVSFMPWLLYLQGKSPWCPSDRMLGGPHNWSGCCGEEKNSCPCQESNPNHPVCTLLLYQLSCRSSCRKNKTA